MQIRKFHIAVLTDVLWDMGGMGQVHCGICEFGLFKYHTMISELIIFGSNDAMINDEDHCPGS